MVEANEPSVLYYRSAWYHLSRQYPSIILRRIINPSTMSTVDILSFVSMLPCDIQGVVYGFHRLNEIESKQRSIFSKMVKHLDFYADTARYSAPFSEYYFSELDTMAETDEVFQEMADIPKSAVVDERSFVEFYGVDDFDKVACKQHELKNRVLQQIGKLVMVQ
jgi:hypothetical protein